MKRSAEDVGAWLFSERRWFQRIGIRRAPPSYLSLDKRCLTAGWGFGDWVGGAPARLGRLGAVRSADEEQSAQTHAWSCRCERVLNAPSLPSAPVVPPAFGRGPVRVSGSEARRLGDEGIRLCFAFSVWEHAETGQAPLWSDRQAAPKQGAIAEAASFRKALVKRGRKQAALCSR